MSFFTSCTNTDEYGNTHVSDFGWLILIFAISFVAYIIYVMIQDKKKSKNFLKEKKLKLEDFYPVGNYVGGHPNLKNIAHDVYAVRFDKNINFYSIPVLGSSAPIDLKAFIPFDTINNITVEDKSSIERRMTVGRLFFTGIFAFAWKKKQRNNDAYLLIEWKDGRFMNTTTFNFTGDNAFLHANNARSAIIKLCS